MLNRGSKIFSFLFFCIHLGSFESRRRKFAREWNHSFANYNSSTQTVHFRLAHSSDDSGKAHSHFTDIMWLNTPKIKLRFPTTAEKRWSPPIVNQHPRERAWTVWQILILFKIHANPNCSHTSHMGCGIIIGAGSWCWWSDVWQGCLADERTGALLLIILIDFETVSLHNLLGVTSLCSYLCVPGKTIPRFPLAS